MEKITEAIRIKLRSDKKLLPILLAGLAGILLLAFSSFVPGSEGKAEKTDADSTQMKMTRELEALLKTVDGVGKVRVYLTIESLEESEYAKNIDVSEKETAKEKKDEYVLIGDGGNKKGLVIRSLQPVVKGVAVSCSGGGSNVVRREVTGLVCAALGIKSDRVWVTKMKND